MALCSTLARAQQKNYFLTPVCCVFMVDCLALFHSPTHLNENGDTGSGKCEVNSIAMEKAT